MGCTSWFRSDDAERKNRAVKGINEDLRWKNAEIYLPLSRLLNFYISSNLRRRAVLSNFLHQRQRIPYIISIAGSVAVGKVLQRVLQALLSRWPEHRHVELITTDGFLHPNSVLKRTRLDEEKGFRSPMICIGWWSLFLTWNLAYKCHRAGLFYLIYDVIPDGDKPLLNRYSYSEGLNVLQSGMDYPRSASCICLWLCRLISSMRRKTY